MFRSSGREDMSVLFEAVERQRHQRRSEIMDFLPRNRGLFDTPAPSSAFEIDRPSSGKADHRVSEREPFLCNLHPVYVMWATSVTALFTPFFVQLIKEWNTGGDDFPYDCKLFFLSLVIGLPASSVHLFCCTLCLLSRNRNALLLSVLSMFCHILTVEYQCGISQQSSVPMYLMTASVFTGTFSNILLIEKSKRFTYEYSRAWTSFAFSVTVIVTILAAVTTFVSDVFGIHLSTAHVLYMKSIPIVFGIAMYLLASAWTLDPIFWVIDTLSREVF